MSTICDDLRAAILQAAMQGKLTQRLSSDDSAESNITKHANVDFATDDNCPEEWRFVTFGDIAEMGMGKTILKADMKANGIPVYSATISDKHLGYIDNPTLTLKRGDIVIPARGNSIGWATLVKEDEATCTQTTIYCKNIKDFIRPKFLWICCYAFKDAWFKYEGSAIPQITVTTIRKHLVPIPSLSEQDRIIEKVDALVDRITDLEQSTNALVSLKKAFPDDIKASLLQAAMQGKLTKQLPEDGSAEDLLEEIKAEKEKLIAEGKIKKQKPLAPITDDEIPFSIPENWKWVRLNDIVVKEIRRGKPPVYDKNGSSFAFAQKCNTKYTGIDLSLAKAISNNSLKKYSEDDAIATSDIIVNSTGTGTLGRVGFIDPKIPMNTNYYPDSHVTIVRVPKFISNYVYAILKNSEKYFEEKGEGSTNQKELKPLTIQNLIIPLPPIAEQKRIVERLNAILQNVNAVGDLIASE